jgi:hypothetical protein
LGKKTRLFGAILCYKNDRLPRQTRDKRRQGKALKREPFSFQGKKVVVVVNKADLLMPSNGASAEDLPKVLEFVRGAAVSQNGLFKAIDI